MSPVNSAAPRTYGKSTHSPFAPPVFRDPYAAAVGPLSVELDVALRDAAQTGEFFVPEALARINDEVWRWAAASADGRLKRQADLRQRTYEAHRRDVGYERQAATLAVDLQTAIRDLRDAVGAAPETGPDTGPKTGPETGMVIGPPLRARVRALSPAWVQPAALDVPSFDRWLYAEAHRRRERGYRVGAAAVRKTRELLLGNFGEWRMRAHEMGFDVMAPDWAAGTRLQVRPVVMWLQREWTQRRGASASRAEARLAPVPGLWEGARVIRYVATALEYGLWQAPSTSPRHQPAGTPSLREFAHPRDWALAPSVRTLQMMMRKGTVLPTFPRGLR